jgi:hypothetical protein
VIVACEDEQCEIPLVAVARAVLKLASDLPVRMAKVRPTMAFLAKVSELLQSHGVQNCDTTAAWQFWLLINESVDKISDEFAIDSEIAWAYHIDPSTLSERVKFGLERNIHRNYARQRLQDGDYSPTDYEGVYQLAILATGDEEYAQRMKTKAFERYVKQKTEKGAS